MNHLINVFQSAVNSHFIFNLSCVLHLKYLYESQGTKKKKKRKEYNPLFFCLKVPSRYRLVGSEDKMPINLLFVFQQRKKVIFKTKQRTIFREKKSGV